MVVVAIIGILLSMLLPALSKARNASEGTVCLSYKKQNGTAISMYIEDNEDRLPRDWAENEPPWQAHVKSYLGPGNEGYRTVVCPSDRREGVSEIYDIPWTYKWLVSYGYNNWLQNNSDPNLIKGVPIGMIERRMILTVDFNDFSAKIPNNGWNMPLDRHLYSGVNALWVDMSATFQKNAVEISGNKEKFWQWWE